MAIQVIDTGVRPNDGTGDKIPDALNKVNENFEYFFNLLGVKHQKLKWKDLSQSLEFAEEVNKRFEFLEMVEKKTN